MPASYRFLWWPLQRVKESSCFIYILWQEQAKCTSLLGSELQGIANKHKWMHVHFLRMELQIKLCSCEGNTSPFQAVSTENSLSLQVQAEYQIWPITACSTVPLLCTNINKCTRQKDLERCSLLLSLFVQEWSANSRSGHACHSVLLVEEIRNSYNKDCLKYNQQGEQSFQNTGSCFN